MIGREGKLLIKDESNMSCMACFYPMNLFKSLITHLSGYSPIYRVKASNIDVLHEPTEYYSAIVNGIRTANDRVLMASLYIGHEELEKKLVIIFVFHSS